MNLFKKTGFSLLLILLGFCYYPIFAEEFDSKIIANAIKQIQAGSTEKSVFEGISILEKISFKDIDLLLNELTNKNPASIQLQEPLKGRDADTGLGPEIRVTTVGDVILGIIQSKIEGQWPRYYLVFRVLNKENARAWITDRKGKSFKSIRVEAAELALAKIEKTYPEPRTAQEMNIIKRFKSRLELIKSGGTADIND